VPTGRRGDPSHMRRENFVELRKAEVGLLRIPLPRTTVNNGKQRKGGAANNALPLPTLSALWALRASRYPPGKGAKPSNILS
jgi:hypothetical protein